MQRVVHPSVSHRVIIAEGPDEGVRFASTADNVMLSEEIPDELAEAFCKIGGYSLWVKPPETRPTRNEARQQAKETTDGNSSRQL